MNKAKIKQLLSLLIVFLMIIAVSIRRDGKWLGHSIRPVEKTEVDSVSTVRQGTDAGTIIINTTHLGKDIIGYGGPVPLEITIKDGVIADIKALENSESPEFFSEASTLLSKWKGKTPAAAAALKVDAVTGATFSSKAIIGNMQRALALAQSKAAQPQHWYSKFDPSAKTLIGILVALMAALIPLFYHNRTYRTVQQVLNVAVLGFWCGSCVSYASIVSFMSNGLSAMAFPVATLLLIVAFVYPLFGKKSYYCTNVCPYGSLQELADKCVPYKLKMKPATVKHLDKFREAVWAMLMLCLWTGVWFGWVDYEPFSAFILQSASWIVVVIAAVFVVLSAVVPRPYCRFVCPMGTLFKISQSSK